MTIDLAGKTVNRNLTEAVDNGCIFVVESSLSITDSVGGGTLTGANGKLEGGAISVAAGGTLSMTSGTISGNTTTTYGGGVYAKGNATIGNWVVIENNTGGWGSGVRYIGPTGTVLTISGAPRRRLSKRYCHKPAMSPMRRFLLAWRRVPCCALRPPLS